MLRPVLKTRFHISASETVASAMNRGMFISGLSRMPFCTSLPFVATTVLGYQDELSVDLCSVPVAVCDGILASRLSKPRAVRIASQLYGLSLGRELALEVLNPGTPSILLGEMFVLCKQWCSDWSLKENSSLAPDGKSQIIRMPAAWSRTSLPTFVASRSLAD
jgi:hypothetical protein